MEVISKVHFKIQFFLFIFLSEFLPCFCFCVGRNKDQVQSQESITYVRYEPIFSCTSVINLCETPVTVTMLSLMGVQSLKFVSLP